MGTLSGQVTLSINCASHINWGHLIKKRICSHRSKFFPLRVDPISVHRPPGMQTGSHENCLSLKTWRNPYTLKAISSLQSEEEKKTNWCQRCIFLLILLENRSLRELDRMDG